LKDVREAELATMEKGDDITHINTQVFLGMRYIGQAHELDVEIDPHELLVSLDTENLNRKFNALHHQRYGQTDSTSGSEITGYKVRTSGYRDIPRPKQDSSVSSHNESNRHTLFFDHTRGEFVEAPVFTRNEITTALIGPAIIEQPDCTVVVQPNWRVRTDEGEVLILERVTSDSEPSSMVMHHAL